MFLISIHSEFIDALSVALEGRLCVDAVEKVVFYLTKLPNSQ